MVTSLEYELPDEDLGAADHPDDLAHHGALGTSGVAGLALVLAAVLRLKAGDSEYPGDGHHPVTLDLVEHLHLGAVHYSVGCLGGGACDGDGEGGLPRVSEAYIH